MKTLFLKKEIRPVTTNILPNIEAACGLQDFRPLTPTVIYTRIYSLFMNPAYGDVLRAFGYANSMLPNESYVFRPAKWEDITTLFIRKMLLTFFTENNPFSVITKPRAIQADLIRAFKSMREAALAIKVTRVQTALDTLANLANTYYFNYSNNPDVATECYEMFKSIECVQVAGLGLFGTPYTDKRTMVTAKLTEDVSLISNLIDPDFFAFVGKETLKLDKVFNRGYMAITFGSYLPDRSPYSMVVHSNIYQGTAVTRLTATGKFRRTMQVLHDPFNAIDESLSNHLIAGHMHSTAMVNSEFVTLGDSVWPRVLLTTYSYDSWLAGVYDIIEFTPDNRSIALAEHHHPTIEGTLKSAKIDSSQIMLNMNLMELMEEVLIRTDLKTDVNLVIDKKVQELLLHFYDVPDAYDDFYMNVNPGTDEAGSNINWYWLSAYALLSSPYNPIDGIFYPRSNFFHEDGFYENKDLVPFQAAVEKIGNYNVQINWYVEDCYKIIRDVNSHHKMQAKLSRIDSIYQTIDAKSKEQIRWEVISELIEIGKEVMDECMLRPVYYGSLRNQQILHNVNSIAYAIAAIKLWLDCKTVIFNDITLNDVSRVTRFLM